MLTFITGMVLSQLGYQPAENLTIFFSFIIFLVAVVVWIGTSLESKNSLKLKAELSKTYHDGKHLPKWADNLFYWTLIILFVAYGWIFTGFMWITILIIDNSFRGRAKNAEGDKDES
jgi:uncharacterized membrane protein